MHNRLKYEKGYFTRRVCPLSAAVRKAEESMHVTTGYAVMSPILGENSDDFSLVFKRGFKKVACL